MTGDFISGPQPSEDMKSVLVLELPSVGLRTLDEKQPGRSQEDQVRSRLVQSVSLRWPNVTRSSGIATDF